MLCAYYAVAHLIHAGLIESHDGGVGEPVEHGAQGLLGIKLLRLEKLFQELFVEHGGDNVIHDYSDKERSPHRKSRGSVNCTIHTFGSEAGKQAVHNSMCVQT